jgi:hypothetical protein
MDLEMRYRYLDIEDAVYDIKPKQASGPYIP